MATMNLATLLVRLKAATGGYKRNLKGAEKSTSKFGKRATKALKGLAVGGFAVATAAATKFVKDSVAEFREFEKASAEVFTLMPDLTEAATDSMRQDMLDFGVEVGRQTDETIPAFYQAISAGVPRENVFDFMRVASDAALGGVTDLETAVDGLTSVVNAYGEGAIDAQEASDILFTGIRLGKTTYDELAGSISDVTPLAAALGVRFEDVTAALSAMTVQGTKTGKATIQLRGLLQELSKEGATASEAFKEAAGVGFADFIEQGGNLVEALQIMEEHAAATGVPLRDMFDNIRGGLGALQLTGEGAEVFADNLEEVQGASGATGEAAEEMADTSEQAAKEMAAAFENLKIVIGEEVEPAVTGFMKNTAEQLTLMAKTERWNQMRSELLELGASWGDINEIVDDGRAKFDLWRTAADFERDIDLTEKGLRRLETAMEAVNMGLEVGTPAFNNWVEAVSAGRDVIAEHPEQVESASRADIKWTGVTEEVTEAVEESTDAVEDQGEALTEAEKLAQDFNLAGRETVDTTGEIAANARHVTNEYREQQKEAERTAEATRKYEQALADAEAALGSYFEKALDGQDINEDLLDQFLSIAAQQGANAQELRNIAAATGNYSDEQINTAVTSATLHTEFTKVTEAWAAGRITADQATEAINLLEQGERGTADAAIGMATTMSTTVASALHQTQQNALDTKLGVGDMSEEMDEVPTVTESEFDDKGTYFEGFKDAERLLNKLELLDGKTTTSTHTTNFVQGGTAGASGGGQGGNFQHGGFTGGQPNQPAGIVHGQEFVFSAPAVRNVGVNFLSDLHDAARRGNGAQMSGGGNVTIENITVVANTPMQARPQELAGEIARNVVGRG